MRGKGNALVIYKTNTETGVKYNIKLGAFATGEPPGKLCSVRRGVIDK